MVIKGEKKIIGKRRSQCAWKTSRQTETNSVSNDSHNGARKQQRRQKAPSRLQTAQTDPIKISQL